MVINNPIIVSICFFAKILLCAQVILTPEDNNMIVFKKGKPQGFKTSIPCGGHVAPICIEEIKLEWKNAREKPKKNIISDVINKTIPKRRPFTTLFVWLPSKVDSVITSVNQRYKQNRKKPKERWIFNIPASRHKCIYTTILEVNAKSEKDVNNGHGLGVTI